MHKVSIITIVRKRLLKMCLAFAFDNTQRQTSFLHAFVLFLSSNVAWIAGIGC